MSLRSIFKGAMLVTASAALIAVITIAGILALAFYYSDGGRSWSVSVTRVSDALTYDGTGYDFSGDELLGDDRWAILIGEDGQVIWSLRKPTDVPEQYTLTDVASFTRWYLNDYPVQCRIREDGLLVVGSPKGSIWKHDISTESRLLHDAPLWCGGIFLLALGCVLLLAYFAVRRWFRQAQHVRDSARSNWINGVSHDIRTPLSVVMGYAAQLEEAPDLSPEHKGQAAAIRVQSQVIRELVNDLNLTMRLDFEMQPLRKESLQPEAFLRQVAADFLNGGMAEGFDFEMDLPEEPLPRLEADPFLLRRAVNNLLINAVKHNRPGGSIRLGAETEGNMLVFRVEGGTGAGSSRPGRPEALGPDGGAAHGTGLKLVAQIAAAHGGRADFYGGTPYRCRLCLPVSGASVTSRRSPRS
ncbi:MAG: HAMP domain-containing sensor histidine kinase [Oscillospiraceae bacterium]